MAATAQLAAPARRSSLPARCLTRWHLLSLDAPTVAATWTWAIARTCNVRLPWPSLLAMGLAVWMLYVTDRLLDARVLNGPANEPPSGQPEVRELEARHFFHHWHRRRFAVVAALAALGLAALIPLLAPAAVRLYAMEAAFLCGWFLMLHASNLHRAGNSHRLPKEIAVGLFFAAAVFIPTVARDPALRLALLPVAALLAGVCSLNCLFIYSWEHEHEPGRSNWRGGDDSSRCHASTRFALRHLFEIAAALAVAGVALGVAGHLAGPGLLWTLPAACAVSAALLLLLHRLRRRTEPTTLRAAADVALLTPLLLLALLLQ